MNQERISANSAQGLPVKGRRWGAHSNEERESPRSIKVAKEKNMGKKNLGFSQRWFSSATSSISDMLSFPFYTTAAGVIYPCPGQSNVKQFFAGKMGKKLERSGCR
jgi:hypothetical protein